MTDTTAIVKAPDPLREISQWIIDGRGAADIQDAIARTWPKRKAQPLIIAALAEIAKQAEPDPAVVKGFAIEGTRQIYSKALELGDHQTALRALKQLVELSKQR